MQRGARRFVSTAMATAISGLIVTLPADAALIAPLKLSNFELSVLAVHAKERAEVGVAPLQWDRDLAEDARRWAMHLARERVFEHETNGRLDQQGENLFMATARAMDVKEMLDDWAQEKSLIDGPNDWYGHFPEAGHYTQMVWRHTSRVGCAMVRNNEDDYLVCRYTAPGNVIGEPAW